MGIQEEGIYKARISFYYRNQGYIYVPAVCEPICKREPVVRRWETNTHMSSNSYQRPIGIKLGGGEDL